MSRTLELRVHPDVWQDQEALRSAAARASGIPKTEIQRIRVLRKAIDARRGRVQLQLKVAVVLVGETEQANPRAKVELPVLRGEPEVVIVGAGPAGLFCAWQLARRGVRARVLERGRDVRARRKDLAALTRHGTLDPESNYCYGEGGAGTFSDGKLYTRADKRGEVQAILETLVDHGADEGILVDARPHIGTNRLPGVVSALRESLIGAGVEFCFETRADGLEVREGKVVGVVLRGGDTVPAKHVVVAPGHSARDVHAWCRDAGAEVEFKPFAMGVRVEHPQTWIDRQQFGRLAGHVALGAASYRLVERVGETSVFSFCMCPGGFVAPAATEPQMQVVNGWSPSSRGGRYANSGFVAEVGPSMLRALGLRPDLDPFAGTEAQRRLERDAYAAGGGGFVAPAQTLTDFVEGRVSSTLPPSSYPRGMQPAELRTLLGPLAAPILGALERVNAKMPGFICEDAVALGVESRTSCPVRLVRGDDLQSPSVRGLYPCGEGAGYAGGIMSAALDGVRVANQIAGDGK